MSSRYIRQEMVPGVGKAGQARIESSTFRLRGSAQENQAQSEYALRAGLSAPSPQAEAALPPSPIAPSALEASVAHFFTEPACRALALGAARALQDLDSALSSTENES